MKKDNDIDMEQLMSNAIGVEGDYTLFESPEGDIIIEINAREGEPDFPLFLYDGKETALMVRSFSSAMTLKNVDEGARPKLAKAESVYVYEVLNDDIVNEYVAPVRIVDDVNEFILSKQGSN